MEFQAHVGVGDDERAERQVIAVDVEIVVDLRPAGVSDDLEQTVDYGDVFKRCRQVVETRSFSLLEAVAEHIATEVLDGFGRVEAITVRVRKPGVPIDGILDHAEVEIHRSR